jgi:hypothetical protein
MDVTAGTSCGDVKLPHQSSIVLPDEFKPIPQSLDINMNQAIEIQELTKDQTNSEKWHEERKNV